MRTKIQSSGASPVLVWFRRDLRLSDHSPLSAAAKTGAPIIPVYVLDDATPGDWRPGGASQWWLAQSLRSLDRSLRERGSRLVLRRGEAATTLATLAKEAKASAVYFTRGYEPFQRRLEDRVKNELAVHGVECHRFGGQVLVEPERLLNKSGEAFRVYSAFQRALSAEYGISRPLPAPSKLTPSRRWPESGILEDWELEPTHPDWAGGLRAAWMSGEAAAQSRLSDFIGGMIEGYARRRDLPGIDGTSKLSPHLAFGELSPRQVWNAVMTAAEAADQPALGDTYLREITWREFSYHLLFHFRGLPDKPLKSQFERFPWRNDEAALRSWRKGKTGYPIVDAGMRQLWQTGWMHNRVRMVTASFLIKHLFIPWQIGEAWFWDTLVDADLANNAASWQWVAGSGADAAPYFRIFNPVLQGEKFDPKGDYVRRFCPELTELPPSLIHKPWQADAATLTKAGVEMGETYPWPIVDHNRARQRALAAYQTTVQKRGQARADVAP